MARWRNFFYEDDMVTPCVHVVKPAEVYDTHSALMQRHLTIPKLADEEVFHCDISKPDEFAHKLMNSGISLELGFKKPRQLPGMLDSVPGKFLEAARNIGNPRCHVAEIQKSGSTVQ